MNGRRITLTQVNWIDGYKPRCLWCSVPCHPRSYEYRKCHLCPWCYDQQPIVLKKKELLCPQP